MYRKGRAIATANRALATLRAAINWGRFQDPPFLTTTPTDTLTGRSIRSPFLASKGWENRRIPCDPQGPLAPILTRRKSLGPSAFVFGSPAGEYVDSLKTAWESLLLVANGHDTNARNPLLVSIARSFGRSTCTGTISVTRVLNITDEELRKAMTGVWERRRQLRAAGQ